MPKGRIVITLVFAFLSSTALSSETDKSSLSTNDMAVCGAAALESERGSKHFMHWKLALSDRYERMFPERSKTDLGNYINEQIIYKRRYLESNGINTPYDFRNFYDVNCYMVMP